MKLPWKAQTIYGRDGAHKTPYMTRFVLGHLRVHIFHRADQDEDPHDHPWAFITLPLRGYWEAVYEPGKPWFKYNYVKPFRFHYRPSSYTHRYLHLKRGRVVTIVWSLEENTEWGFWKIKEGFAEKVPWKTYVYGNA